MKNLSIPATSRKPPLQWSGREATTNDCDSKPHQKGYHHLNVQIPEQTLPMHPDRPSAELLLA